MNDVVNPDTYERLAISARDNGLYVVTMNRPSKRNALDVATIEELIRFFSGARMAGVRAVLLAGEGDHFCAGLDLVEHWKADRSPDDFMHVCLRWHEAFNKMEYGGVPVIAALQGAVVGGGKAMELAEKVAQNLPLTNFAICSAVSHMNNMSGMDAAYAEAFVGGIVNTQPAARARLEAFANKTAARVRPNS